MLLVGLLRESAALRDEAEFSPCNIFKDKAPIGTRSRFGDKIALLSRRDRNIDARQRLPGNGVHHDAGNATCDHGRLRRLRMRRKRQSQAPRSTMPMTNASLRGALPFDIDRRFFPGVQRDRCGFRQIRSEHLRIPELQSRKRLAVKSQHLVVPRSHPHELEARPRSRSAWCEHASTVPGQPQTRTHPSADCPSTRKLPLSRAPSSRSTISRGSARWPAPITRSSRNKSVASDSR